MASSSTSPLGLLPNFPRYTTNYSTSSSSFHSSSIISPKCLLQYQKGAPLFSNKTRLKLHQQHQPRSLHVVAVQSNFLKVFQTVLKVGKDGIEAGTDLVPDSVPRPVARIAVGGVIGAISIFVLKSVLSTAFFVLATMGLIYFVYIALNKGDGPRGPRGGGDTSTTEDSLEEARRIMEKYK